MIREKIFEWKNWKEMIHTTWNPKDPGVIRIHMIPPKFHLFHFIPSVVILNGNQILPLNESWAILLTVFIKELNQWRDGEMTREQGQEIVENTVIKMRKIFPDVLPEKFQEDLELIAEVFEDIARGRVPEVEIGQMSIGDYAPYMKIFPDVLPEKFQEDLELIAEVFEDIARGRVPEVEIGQMSIGDYAPYMAAPHRMDLMVSAMEKNGRWNCNQHCLHCYAAGQKYSNGEELGTEDWKKIIEKCKKARIPQLTFTGGEPTMREDLCELLKEATWFITRLNTNGVKLTREYCERLKEAELDNVQITFYSWDEQIHNRLTGSAQYRKTVEGIKNALASGLSVNVNTPLCTWNADYVETVKFLKSLGVTYVTCSGLIPAGNAVTDDSQNTRLTREQIRKAADYVETVKFLKSLGVTYVTCSGLIPAGNAVTDDSQNTRLTREQIRKAVEDAAAYCWEHGMEISFTSPGWIEETDLQKMGLEVPSCGAALSNMAVTPDGSVVACQSCLDRESFGNILTTEWKTIWEHPMCKKYRAFSAQMRQECPLGKEEVHA